MTITYCSNAAAHAHFDSYANIEHVGLPGLLKAWFFGFCFFFLNKKTKNLQILVFWFFTNFKIINAKNVVSSSLLAIVVWSLLTSFYDILRFYCSS